MMAILRATHAATMPETMMLMPERRADERYDVLMTYASAAIVYASRYAI